MGVTRFQYIYYKVQTHVETKTQLLMGVSHRSDPLFGGPGAVTGVSETSQRREGLGFEGLRSPTGGEIDPPCGVPF